MNTPSKIDFWTAAHAFDDNKLRERRQASKAMSYWSRPGFKSNTRQSREIYNPLVSAIRHNSVACSPCHDLLAYAEQIWDSPPEKRINQSSRDPYLAAEFCQTMDLGVVKSAD